MKKCHFIFLLFYYIPIGAQTISLGDINYIDLPFNFVVKDAILDTDEVLLAGFLRDTLSGNIDSYAILIDNLGATKKIFHLEQAGAFSQIERCVQYDEDYYLLENSSGPNKNLITVYQLDSELKLKDKFPIVDRELCLGKDILFLNEQTFLVAFWDGSNFANSFPVIHKYDLSGNKIGEVSLDKANEKYIEFGEPDQSWTEEQKESFVILRKYQKTKLVKQVHKLVLGEDGVYVLGSENTTNISDYWLCKIDLDLNYQWEYLFKDEGGMGTDWLLDGYVDSDKLRVAGYQYSKKHGGYNFNYLVFDGNGLVEQNKIYDYGNDEVTEGIIRMDALNVQYGYSIDRIGDFIDFDNDHELLILLLNNNGDILDRQNHKIAGFKNIIQAVKLENDSILFLGEQVLNSQSRYFALEGKLIYKP